MPLKMLLACECSVAVLTVVGRLTCVDADVIGQMLLAGETLRAERAAMWRFPCVLTYMISQVFFSRKAFVTECTLMRGLTGVSSNVVRQMVLAGEGLGAVLAGEGGFPCVLPLVINHVIFTSE